MRKPIQFHWKTTHHLYIGMITIILAVMIALNKQLAIWENNIFLLGIYIVVDDVVEHTITATTPLRILSEKIIEPIQKKINCYIKGHFKI